MFFSFQFVYISSVLISWAVTKSYVLTPSWQGCTAKGRKRVKFHFWVFMHLISVCRVKRNLWSHRGVAGGMGLKTAWQDAWFREVKSQWLKATNLLYLQDSGTGSYYIHQGFQISTPESSLSKLKLRKDFIKIRGQLSSYFRLHLLIQMTYPWIATPRSISWDQNLALSPEPKLFFFFF